VTAAAVCVAVAFSSTVLARLPAPLTLAWTHTVEKIRIEEDYRVAGGALILTQVRTRGLGAGIDIPPGARLENGWWQHAPSLPPLPRVLLTNSRLPAGYEVCYDGRCRRLSEIIGNDDRMLALTPCL
jgi:hypothetical protein